MRVFATFSLRHCASSPAAPRRRAISARGSERLLSDTDFLRWFLNSVAVAGFTMLVGVAMSAAAGYALSLFNFPGKRSLMWTFLVTQMFPVAVLIVPIYTIMSNLGLINSDRSRRSGG